MNLSFYRLIWLLPVAFVLHLIEEFFTGYPAYAGAVTGHAMTLPMFLGPNILFVVIMALLTGWVAKTRKATAVFWLLAWAAGNQFWNFVYHLIAVPAHDRHSPGLISGALVYLPLSLAVWQSALAEKQIGCKPLAGAILLGGAFMALVAAIGIYHVGGV